MKVFTYTITDVIGIHARPAGLLVKEAKDYNSKITIGLNGKTAEATKLMAIMSLGVKCGNEVKITVEGEDEAVALEGIRTFFEQNL